MQFKPPTTIVLLPVAGFVVAMTAGAGLASAASAKQGNLLVTKECSQYTGAAGDFCTITSSNLPEIKVGSKVYYDLPAGIPTGMLDSNVLLDVGTGDWAVGRCTLDLTTGLGLCTFSDGTGKLTGFQARISVSATGGPNFQWQGTYTFVKEPK